MNAKFLSLLAGAALLGGVSVAGAAEPLTSTQMDNVVAAGYLNTAYAFAGAVALGPNSRTETSTFAETVYGEGSASESISYAESSAPDDD